jgi:hypothetical protein
MGERNRRRRSIFSTLESAAKTERSEYGSFRSSRGGMNRARALFQKASLGNISLHHVCQRAMVLRETSKSRLSSL